ncbi:MAG: hypothetical protein KDD11_23980, partial [Acidobacteria bacterium]|nr:hypothetical protein [Acidobacteriota bacterium]
MKDELKELTFTAYVRLLSDDGTPPTVEAFDAVLRRLAGALRFEMRRRSLWSSPPSYVGIYGGERWTEDLFEELLLDCYAFIFVRRIVGLKNQAEVREDIDGLVFLNIRNFLHEAQQRCDPIGYLVFDRLHGAVRQLLDRGTLSLLDGDPRIRNDTVLGFAAGGETVFPKDAPDDLGALVASWVPGLLPDLVTSRDQEAVVEQLAARLELLPGAGFDVFRFYDVVDPLKHHIRLHWFQLAAGDTDAATQRSSEDFERLVRLVWPQQGIEDRDFFDKLVECVEESLARVPGTRKKRRYLEQLWSYLRAWAAEPGHARGEGKGGPPHLRIAKLLGIPRGRIPELKEELGEVIERCRERLSALAGGPRGSKGGNGDGEGGPMSAGDRRDRLRLATAEALAARAAEPRAPEATAGREVVPGHRFVVARVRAYPAEWLVVYRDGDRVQVVPVD